MYSSTLIHSLEYIIIVAGSLLPALATDLRTDLRGVRQVVAREAPLRDLPVAAFSRSLIPITDKPYSHVRRW